MISHFFIDRPIFASVLSIVITLTGALALLYLPIAQYPQITPPAVSISILYPGASAQVVSDTVAAPIEQQVNGVEGMLYMASQMGNDGSYTLTVTFEVGTDLNTALVMVQNRVTLALPLLPIEVQRQGITVRKRTPDILMIVSLFSPDGRYDDLYLSNFATLHIRDELLRVEGVSDIIIFGQRDYAIRAWLDPQKIASYGLNAGEVAAAVLGQNADVPAGQVGQPPATPGQPFQLPIDTLGRLSDPEQFGNIIVKSGALTACAAPTVVTPTAPSNTNATVPLPGRLIPQPSAGLLGATSNMASNTAVSGLGAPVIDVFGSGSTTLSALISGSQYQPSGTGSSVPGGMSSLSNFTAVGTVHPRTGNPAVAAISSGNVGGGTIGGGGTTGGGATIGGGATTGGPLSSALTSAVANQSTAANAIGLSVAALSVNGQTTGLSTTASGGQRPPDPSVGIVRLPQNVARVELGAQNYNQAQTFDGHQSVGIAVFQLPNTNALDVAGRVNDKLEELKSRFPDGVNYQVPYDTTPFIRESVADVVKTLFEAVFLVALVVLVFLQNWRTTLIPLAAVPVAIFGTFAAMAIVGFSLNNISLFGLVLAIGIVVDDAIVVVENVERWMEHGLEPREATMRAMTEVTGPVIAVALVLCAVFVPCAFISGITGRFFRQFAVTIAVSTAFSAINSLTLSPALAALLLKKKAGVDHPSRMPSRGSWLRWALQLPAVALQWFFRRFDAVFGSGINGYAWLVGKLLRLSLVAVVLYGVLIVATYEVFHHASTGFVPEQDQGRILASIQLPDAASLERTREALAKIDQIARSTEGIEHALTVAGFSFVQQANGPNFASMFMSLKPFDERRTPRLRDTAIMARLRRACAEQVKDAQFLVFGAPIPGLSVAGGFKLIVEDRGGLGLPTLGQQTDALIRRLQKEPRLVGVSTQFRANTPQLFMDIDRSKVASVGIALSDVNQTLGIYLGSLYVNSFNLFGRHWQVELQAQGKYRNDIANLRLLEIRNAAGQMVPLSTMVDVRDIGGPIFVNRYNLYTAASITGSLRPGVSSGEVIAAVDAMAGETLPLAMKTEWTELMYMQIHEGNTAIYVFGLAVVCVFLALAALYESWSLPLAVILVVPLCLLCSIAGVLYTHRAVDIFVQIGLVVLVGLACKNAILVVEFAKYMHEGGRPRFEATVEASRLRLRPILMTSFAFILGVVPLVFATGAGSEMRQSLGTAVFSGMVGVTLFGIFLTPVAFYVIQGISETRLFSSAAMHWIGSAALGAALGAGFGYSLTQLGIGSMPWAAVYGAVVGLLLFAALMWIHQRVRH